MFPLVLSLDDERSSQILMRAYLQDEQFCSQLVCKNSGAEALDYLQQIIEDSDDPDAEFPQVFILDINMPEMDGWEFIEAATPLLKQLSRLPAILMLSATNTPEDIEKARNHPLVMDITTKPLSNEVLSKLKANTSQNLRSNN